MHLFAWLLVAALVVAVLIPIARGVVRMRKTLPVPEPERKRAATVSSAVPILSELITQSDEEQLLMRARQLAEAGDFGASLQLYLFASLRALDKRGAVRLTKDRTNGEYVRGCGDASAKPALRDIVREVDRVQFGGERPSQEAVERAAQRAIAIVRSLPMFVLLLVFASGCSGLSAPKPRVRGDDPAGFELLRDVLHGQGVTVSGLPTSLATMPLPEPGAREPAVVVDTDITDLDDETREHLASWVEAGGVLVLAGFPASWPKPIGASRETASGVHKITARRLLARAVPPKPGSEDEESDDEETVDPEPSAIYAHDEEHAEVVASDGLKVKGAADRVAWFDEGTPYALSLAQGKGTFVLLATDELFTNVGLARGHNAAALVAILASTSRTAIRMADAEDGVSPPSTPLAALLRAGLGLPLGHAAVFAIVLFLAVGIRLARPKPRTPPRRRAFVEHVEAVGTLYARARSAPHALSAYARFADERLRARMPRGTGDVATFLASRARMPLEACQRVWVRAMQAKAGAPPLGDELAVLRELSALYAAAVEQER
jgi:hypothetical protein